MSLLMRVDLPSVLSQGATPSPSRSALRRAIENRVRPRLNKLASELPGVSFYPTVDDYQVRQFTDDTGIEFQLVNAHPMASILLARGGTSPHIIVQEPHVVPRGKLEAWADRFTDVNAQWLAGFAQARIARRGVVIQHPGTREDEPVWRRIDDAQGTLMSDVTASFNSWLNRWGQG